MVRGVSPHASVDDSPTASRRRQISGTSSILIWMFCRSVMSAVPRANSCDILPITRSCSVVSRPPSMRTRIMKYQGESRAALKTLGCATGRRDLAGWAG